MSYSQELFKIELYSEHFLECGFNLSTVVLNKLEDAYLWTELHDIEKLIGKHLDALAIGGELAKNVAMELLDSGDEDELLGSAFMLASLYADDAHIIDFLANIFLQEDQEKIGLISSALKLASNTKLSPQLTPLLQHENALLRANIVEILGYRGDADPRRIWALIHDKEQTVKTAAMVAVMRLGFKEATPAMEQVVLQSRDSFSEHYLLPLLMLGSQKALQYVRLAMQSPNYNKPQYAIYLAYAGNQQDFTLLVNVLQDKDMLLAVIEALGILGDIRGINILLQQLLVEDDELKTEAAKSLNLITGANIKEDVVLIEPEETDLEIEDVLKNNQNLSPEESPEHHQIEVQRDCMDHNIWQQWWQNNMGRFDPAQRYRLGQPYSFFSVLSEITNPTTKYNDRLRAYHELVIRSGTNIPFEPDWFVNRQIHSLKKWQDWWVQNKANYMQQWLFNGFNQ